MPRSSDSDQNAEPRVIHATASSDDMATTSRARAPAKEEDLARRDHVAVSLAASEAPAPGIPSRLAECLVQPPGGTISGLARKWRAAKSIVGYDASRSFRRLSRKTEATSSKNTQHQRGSARSVASAAN